MPQKSIFTKYPLLTVQNSFLSCGLVRTDDSRIRKLYNNIQAFLDVPSIWEGTFRLAALLTDNPLTEPVTNRIIAAFSETDDSSFQGGIEAQIATARAGMALFEYNTDRSILKRIASWCRYLEVEWDQLFAAGRTLFRPADLMELFVRFYRVSGLKSVLRLCTKLRSAAFDWTTALHTIQQIIPPVSAEEEQISFIDCIGVEELDYDQKQILLNHAEMLADGIRYTFYSGVFSGNKQDLTAGKTAWNILQKHHRAICGGTTSCPFLSGTASNARISTTALCAWTEAFAAQMQLSDSEWATDEMIRIVFNGLSYCLNANELPDYQTVNCITQSLYQRKSAELYARTSRAIASAFINGITVKEKGLGINYLLPARYLAMVKKAAIILHSDGNIISFFCKNEQVIPVDVFIARTETAAISIRRSNEKFRQIPEKEENNRTGQYIRLENLNLLTDHISFDQGKTVFNESAHHQGLCWFVRNHLMVFECDKGNYAVAVAKEPKAEENVVKATFLHIEGWHQRNNEPDDIPVLPENYDEEISVTLVPYDRAGAKISLFPRINPLCLK